MPAASGRGLTAATKAAIIAACLIALGALCVPLVLSPWGRSAPTVHDEPARPVLLITTAADPFSTYYAEILRAEGLSGFRTVDVEDLTGEDLAASSLAILARMVLRPSTVTVLTDFVESGGNLIAMRPDPALAPLLGLSPAEGTIGEGYLRIDTSQPPGQGITPQSLQFHGLADRYSTIQGTRVVAGLLTPAQGTTDYPAVSMRTLAGGGHAVAFTYDLARSIVRTRQGNPAWSGQERDGIAPVRPDDLFYGKGAGGYLDMAKVAIPQADEQQRLLANIALDLTGETTALPRFWYFPNGAKAVLVLVSDDPGEANKTRAALAYQTEASPSSCSVDDWECVRSTSLMGGTASIADAELATYEASGFDFGRRVTTDCRNWTPASLRKAYRHQLETFRGSYPALTPQVANRLECAAWSDYAEGAKIGREFGLRLDMNYSYWPGSWVRNRPGFFTGSGMPMKFADTDGTLIDVYQAPTHLVDESGMNIPEAIDAVLDRALDAHGYYGAFGTRYDYGDQFDRQLIAAASRRQVPMVSAAQLQTWLDARNASTLEPRGWVANTVGFRATVDERARALLRGMIPFRTSHGTVSSIVLNGQPLTFDTETIKGVEYAIFTAATGAYTATYSPDNTSPSVLETTPQDGGTLPGPGAGISVVFSEPLDPQTVNRRNIRLLDSDDHLVVADIAYPKGGNTVTIRSDQPLDRGGTFRLEVGAGITDTAGNPLYSDVTVSVTASDGVTSFWAPAEPELVMTARGDRSDLELGLRFSTDTTGKLLGVRFYKADRRASHTVTLWDRRGRQLATATTRKETLKGWQFAAFPRPVALAADTTYTVSYHAPRGEYVYLPNSLAWPYVNGPLTALTNGGVFRYRHGYPDQTLRAMNYLVDVSFRPD